MGARRASPDCHAGKHTACTGQAWDDDEDRVTRCPCSCHVVIESAQRSQQHAARGGR